MKIALISYEFPPDTTGGIGTYGQQTMRMLAERGHHVEVFAGSRGSAGTSQRDGITVHRVHEPDELGRFASTIAPVLAERHRTVGFDVLESSEFGGFGREAVRLVPDIPYVIKLHTPHLLLDRANTPPFELISRTRAYLGALRRGIKPWWHYDWEGDGERIQASIADEVMAPSKAIGDQLTREWQLDPRRVSLVPHAYVPSQELLSVPIKSNGAQISFLGNLHRCKGVFDLLAAAPQIVRKHPDARIRLFGRPNPRCPVGHLLTGLGKSVEVCGFIEPHAIPEMLSQTDVAVFPSLWESFGFACAEAMAAGRAVVASSQALAELIDGGRAGVPIPVRSPRSIARAVNALLNNAAERNRLGQAARDRIRSYCSFERIAPLHEAAYNRAIEHRRSLGSRRERVPA